MSKYNITSCKCCGAKKTSSLKSLKSNKFQNCSSRNMFTQTSATSTDEECKIHNQQITQLLTEVAIALRQKSKLETELQEMKEQAMDMKEKHNEAKEKLVNEINTLKNDNFKIKTELSAVQISCMGEQKDLLNELSNLKSQVLELNKENSKITQDYQREKELLEQQLNLHINEFDKEVKLNNNLKLKIVKYKTKFKNFISYIQSLLEETRENKNQQSREDILEKTSDTSVEVGTNMEDLILRELFFKPNAIPNEVHDTFFNAKIYDKSCH